MRAALLTVAVVMGLGTAFVATPMAKRAKAAPGRPMTELHVRDVIPLSASHQAAVILTPTSGEMVVPVLIDEAAGAQLADQLHGHGMTLGLLGQAIHQLGGKLVRVELSGLDGEGVKARLVLDQHGRSLALEGTAGDTLGLALDAHVPVMASPEVMDGLGMTKAQIRSLTRGLPGHASPGDPENAAISL